MNSDPQRAPDGALLFIYAADSGLFNTVADIGHKIFSPSTYECQLCALTHGYFSVRRDWERFVEQLPVPCLFLHRDQARDLPGVDTANLPAVYRRRKASWQPCIGAETLSGCRDLKQLMALIEDRCTGA